MELPRAREVSNLEASIFSLLVSFLNPVVMAGKGTKRGIIRSLSLWPMYCLSSFLFVLRNSDKEVRRNLFVLPQFRSMYNLSFICIC